MTKIVLGKVRGRMIELAEDVGLADGADVEVSVRALANSSRQEPGAGFLRTEGALADDPHWDAIMEEIHRSRKLERRLGPEEE